MVAKYGICKVENWQELEPLLPLEWVGKFIDVTRKDGSYKVIYSIDSPKYFKASIKPKLLHTLSEKGYDAWLNQEVKTGITATSYDWENMTVAITIEQGNTYTMPCNKSTTMVDCEAYIASLRL
jgi:hypothetical protein